MKEYLKQSQLKAEDTIKLEILQYTKYFCATHTISLEI